MKKKVYYKKEEFSFLLNEKRKAVCLLFRPEKRGLYAFLQGKSDLTISGTQGGFR